MIDRRQPTSTIEFLTRVDSSAARLPTFEPLVQPPARSRLPVYALPAALLVVLALGVVLIRLAF